MRLHDSIISSSDSFLDLNGPTMDSYSFKFRLILNALSPVKILVLIKSKLMSPKMTAISDFWVFIYHSPPHFDKCFRMPYQCRRVQSRNPFFFFFDNDLTQYEQGGENVLFISWITFQKNLTYRLTKIVTNLWNTWLAAVASFKLASSEFFDFSTC